MPTQNVSLSPRLKRFVEARVRSGRYANASEVVRAGLRLLEEEEALGELRLERLRQAAKAGIEDVAAGRFREVAADAVDGLIMGIAGEAGGAADPGR